MLTPGFKMLIGNLTKTINYKIVCILLLQTTKDAPIPRKGSGNQQQHDCTSQRKAFSFGNLGFLFHVIEIIKKQRSNF